MIKFKILINNLIFKIIKTVINLRKIIIKFLINFNNKITMIKIKIKYMIIY